MTTTLESRQTRANHWENMKAIMDRAQAEGRGLTVDEEQTYDRHEAEFNRLEVAEHREREHAAKAARVETIDRNGVVSAAPADRDNDLPERYSAAFAAWVTRGPNEMTTDERASLREGFVAPEKGDRAAAGIGITTAGGYLVPEGFRANIVQRKKAYGNVEAVATVLRTRTGAPLPWPTNDDTGNVGALLAENTAATEQDFTFGMATLGAYKYTSKIVRVSLEFLQDVDWMDAENWIAQRFAERLGRIENQHFTTGTGSSQPQGIVTGATSGKTAAGAAAITADELIDLQHSVDPAYRESPRARFMLSDTALSLVRKLKAAGTGEYLFQTRTAGDVPSLIAGSPYVVNNDMAVPATGVKSVLFGDFEAGYVIRLVMDMSMIRLAERYAEFGQVGFIAFERADGLVQDANAYKALTQA